jgi:hypothetical protein
MKVMPAASAALATFWLVAAAIVELSMTSAPLAMDASRPGWPSRPRNRASTCWLAGSMLMTTSAPCTAAVAASWAIFRPSAAQLVAGGFGEVEGADVVAGFLQVEGHGAAHVAEADECDLHGVVSWWW